MQESERQEMQSLRAKVGSDTISAWDLFSIYVGMIDFTYNGWEPVVK